MNSLTFSRLNIKRVALLTSFLLAFFVAYFPVWKGLISTWYRSDDYSHGFLIIPICLFIAWQKKDEISKIQPGTSTQFGVPFAVLSLLVYLVASYAEIVTLAAFSLVMFIASAIIVFYGWKIFRTLAFPLFLLLFMIPVPTQIYATSTIPLQLLVSKASAAIGSVINIPIYREGNVLHLPDRTLQVVQACSGLRSMMSLMMLSAVFGYLTLKSNIFRSFLFLSSVPSAVFVNIVRVSVILVAMYYLDVDLTEGKLHTVFGVIIFVLALAVIAILRGGLKFWEDQKQKTS